MDDYSFPIQQSIRKDEKIPALEKVIFIRCFLQEERCMDFHILFKDSSHPVFKTQLSRSGLQPFSLNTAMKEYEQKDRSQPFLSVFLKDTVSTLISIVGVFLWLKLALTFFSSVEVFQNGLGHFSAVSYM